MRPINTQDWATTYWELLTVPAIPDLAPLTHGRHWPAVGRQPRWVVVLSAEDYLWHFGMGTLLFQIDRMLRRLCPSYGHFIKINQPVLIPDHPWKMRDWIRFINSHIAAIALEYPHLHYYPAGNLQRGPPRPPLLPPSWVRLEDTPDYLDLARRFYRIHRHHSSALWRSPCSSEGFSQSPIDIHEVE